ncbi:MAG: DNA translocase FtsK 4TM domain-containing protein, partial [Pseudomonadota bacterium]
MALFTGESGATPLFDSTTALALRRLTSKALGLALIALGAALAAALWSYDAGDPSLWTATSRPPVNLLGVGGAIIADPLMTFLGLGAFTLAALLVVWGLRCVVHIGVHRVWARLLVMPLALVLTTIFASTHGIFPGWQLNVGLGGLVGDRIAGGLISLIPLPPVEALRALSLGLGVLTLVAMGAAFGLDWAEARGIWRWLTRSLFSVVGRVMRGLGLGAALGARAAAKGAREGIAKIREARAEPRSAKLGPAEPTGSWRDRVPAVTIPKVPRLGGAGTDDDLPLARREPVLGAAQSEASPQGLSRALRALKAGRDGVEDDIAASRITGFEDETPPEEADAPIPDDALFDDAVARRREEIPGATVSHPPAKAKATSRWAEQDRQPMLALDGLQEAGAYDHPPLDILARAIRIQRQQMSDIALEENARMLETVLEDYGVRGEIVAVKPGPVVTLYELEPAPGLKASRVIGLADDIARSMSALAARVSTVPGRSVIGIELPNSEREKVFLRETLEHPSYGDCAFPLALSLGKDIEGTPIVANLAKMPHLLIAGTTGSGKSVAIN